MAGFAKSFEEAFNKTAPIAAAGTLDAIKEKIKLDTEKNLKQAKLLNIQEAAKNDIELIDSGNFDPLTKDFAKKQFVAISQLKDPDLAADTYKSTKDYILKMEEKSASSRQLAEQISKIPGLYGINPTQNDVATKITGQSQQAQPSMPGQTSAEVSLKLGGEPSVTIKPKSDMELANERFEYAKNQRAFYEGTPEGKAEVLRNKIQEEVKLKETKDAVEAAANSNAAIDAMQSLKSSYYAGFQPIDINLSEADFFDLAQGKVQGLSKILEAKLGKNPEARNYLNNLKSFATTISRGGFSEKGTLTDTDRKVVVDTFNFMLANKIEADAGFAKIEQILSKPGLRAARLRVVNAGEKLEGQSLPFNIKSKAIYLRDASRRRGIEMTDAEILEYLIQNTGK